MTPKATIEATTRTKALQEYDMPPILPTAEEKAAARTKMKKDKLKDE